MLTNPLKDKLEFGDKIWVVLARNAPPGPLFEANPDDIHQAVFLGCRNPGKNDCAGESVLMFGLENGDTHHVKEKNCFNTRSSACRAVISAIESECERLIERKRVFELAESGL